METLLSHGKVGPLATTTDIAAMLGLADLWAETLGDPRGGHGALVIMSSRATANEQEVNGRVVNGNRRPNPHEVLRCLIRYQSSHCSDEWDTGGHTDGGPQIHPGDRHRQLDPVGDDHDVLVGNKSQPCQALPVARRQGDHSIGAAPEPPLHDHDQRTWIDAMRRVHHRRPRSYGRQPSQRTS